MPEQTNNIPPAYQRMVMDAIKEAEARRAQAIAEGKLMDTPKILKEVYNQLIKQMQAAGVDTEDFIPEHYAYVSSGLRRVVNFAMALTKEYPPTHRKGYGEAYYKEITNPDDVIFLFGGGGHGGPPEGPGGPTWPDPEDPPDEDPFFEWVPDAEVSRAKGMLATVRDEWGFGYYDDPHPFIAEVARRLGGRWGRNGKRGNPNDPSEDILAWDFPGYQPQLFDVIVAARERNEIGWSPLAYPQPAGAVWLAP